MEEENLARIQNLESEVVDLKQKVNEIISTLATNEIYRKVPVEFFEEEKEEQEAEGTEEKPEEEKEEEVLEDEDEEIID